MEAIAEHTAEHPARQAAMPGAGLASALRARGLRGVRSGSAAADAFATPEAASDGGACGSLDRSLTLLQSLSTTAAGDVALLGFREASDFAGQVEELSRTVEYLQLLAAGAVDRTRNGAAAAPPGPPTDPATDPVAGWTTGWGDETVAGGPIGWRPASAVGEAWNPVGSGDSAAGTSTMSISTPLPLDDGFRNTAELLRARLRISISEARRRLALAGSVLPRTGLAGLARPPEREELAAAVAAAQISSRAASIITTALEHVRHLADPDTTARMEHNLTRTGTENDPDFLARIARRWTDAIDTNGTEPSEEELRQRQGAFIRHPRRGLHHLEIFATAEQYEHLMTVMNTATNPRTRGGIGAASDAAASAEAADGDGVAASTDADGDGDGASTGAADDQPDGDATPDAVLDRRTRPQKLLDGLIGACKAALTTGSLPTAGGFRPQVMVTIGYEDLLSRLEHASEQGPRYHRSGSPTGTGTFTFTGPVTSSTVRKIACDADIIPVLLGSQGRILDIGRSTRLFPPHIRKAITARDQGCTFPNCTIPAPWCEAHHITYWSQGGTTGTDNGTLLCSHHHHLIHKEQWHIQVRTGIPWFIPPPHLDPHQKPQRNQSFRV